MDFGNKAMYSGRLRAKSKEKPAIRDMLVMHPERIPKRIASQLSFNFSNCSYKGIARQTVAGVRRNEINFVPCLYFSKSKSKIRITAIEIAMEIRSGFISAILNLLLRMVWGYVFDKIGFFKVYIIVNSLQTVTSAIFFFTRKRNNNHKQ